MEKGTMYVSPQLEVIETEVEKGFISTGADSETGGNAGSFDFD